MMYDISEPFEILLVEDEPADANLVKLALKENKVFCHLHHVFDGVEALAFLRREGSKNSDAPRPDLILLDINMPRMNGGEFLTAIKSDTKLAAIPVVVLTTSDTDQDVTASYQMGQRVILLNPLILTNLLMRFDN